MTEPTEQALPDGTTIIIEHSTKWDGWIGTVTRNDHHEGTILRSSPELVMDRALEVAERKEPSDAPDGS